MLVALLLRASGMARAWISVGRLKPSLSQASHSDGTSPYKVYRDMLLCSTSAMKDVLDSKTEAGGMATCVAASFSLCAVAILFARSPFAFPFSPGNKSLF